VLITVNLREIFHLCELRSAANAHFSIRRMALAIAQEVRRVHPALAGFLRLPEGVDAKRIEYENFAQV
jgi:thymidylate synthase ThyX